MLSSVKPILARAYNQSDTRTQPIVGCRGKTAECSVSLNLVPPLLNCLSMANPRELAWHTCLVQRQSSSSCLQRTKPTLHKTMQHCFSRHFQDRDSRKQQLHTGATDHPVHMRGKHPTRPELGSSVPCLEFYPLLAVRPCPILLLPA